MTQQFRQPGEERLGSRTETSLHAFLPCTLRDGRAALEGSMEQMRNAGSVFGFVGELGEVENKPWSCILDPLQGSDGAQEQAAVE